MKTAVAVAAVTAALLGLTSVVPAAARPVSYVGGWTVVQAHDRQATSALSHYTLDRSTSLGWRSEWDRQGEFALHGPQATRLLHRWYGNEYQANFYAYVAAGLAHGVDSNPAAARFGALTGVIADWETRRWFASYRSRLVEAGDVGGNFGHAVRTGFAPYLGDTGALHTWLMVEVDHRPENGEPVGVTPLLRLFKGEALLEMGWNLTQSQPMVNFTYRF
ncbi:MAG: hypothetical protein AAFX85_17495 [Pseudomonadota bacterium]